MSHVGDQPHGLHQYQLLSQIESYPQTLRSANRAPNNQTVGQCSSGAPPRTNPKVRHLVQKQIAHFRDDLHVELDLKSSLHSYQRTTQTENYLAQNDINTNRLFKHTTNSSNFCHLLFGFSLLHLDPFSITRTIPHRIHHFLSQNLLHVKSLSS